MSKKPGVSATTLSFGDFVAEGPPMVGGSAQVYRARRADGAVAAIKVATLDDVVARELALLARLQRQRGPRLLDAGRSLDGRVYIATTWVDGAPLAAPLSEADAWGVARDVALDLAELHEARIFHGDVKGANVLRRGEGEAAESVLIDLGLAGPVGEPATGGTPRYMAPEARRGSPLLAAADLFSLGVLLGELVVPGASAAEDPVALLRATAPTTPLRHLVCALLAEAPGGRPSARTVADLARRALGLAAVQGTLQDRALSVRRTYLSLREPELAPHRALDDGILGAPRAWLTEVLGWMARVAPESARKPLAPILPLGSYARSRWVVALAGEVGASLVFASTEEGALADELLTLARAVPPSAWTQSDVNGASGEAPHTERIRWRAGDWLGLQRALLGGSITSADLRAVEDEPGLPQPLRITLAEVLLRRGEPGRAFVALYGVDGPEATLLRGDLARRRGDVAGAQALLGPLVDDAEHGDGARATLARIAWDRRDLAGARSILSSARGARAEEVRALIRYAEGHPDAAIPDLEAALAGPRDSFERARLLGVRGMLEHAMGESTRGAATFARAAELAREAHSVVDEATYLTGLAAAASDAGQVGTALTAATRAALLWERLEQRAQAARALLARTNALLTIGLTGEATEAAQLARIAGREGGDAVAEGYACLAEVDARLDGGGDPSTPAIAELLARATGTVGAEDDGLRVLARKARIGELDAAALREGDVVASGASAAAQWEWWFARAGAARPEEAASIVVGVVGLASGGGSLGLRGPTLARAAELAAARGELDVFRRLERARHEAALALRQGVPTELQGALGGLRWLHQSSAHQGTLSEEQVADLAHVVRVMSGRDSLSQLFTQALDTMLLWTSAERGMVLTRAGDRLVIRAARNLGKRDMVGDQLALSHGLARRALETGEPTLATDAFATMGNLHASVHALRLRSVLAVPLLARGEALGVVYLDDRTRRGIFGERELSWVRLVASQAAVAIADARDQVLLRRAVRRAERAGAEVTRLLQERDAELSATKSALVRVSRETRFAYDAIRGSSPRIREMLHLVDRVTDSDVPVLVEGESGTGKELVAKAIHGNGLRAKKPFVSENCASLPEGLLESTLFGHVRGAFTGATGSRIGLFEVADGGTLFLDEIGEMSAGLQAKLLRALQEGEIRPVGSERTRKVDVRVIGATHRDLAAMVQTGAFREDLFYRLNVVSIRVPPLRERSEDIPDLVQHFLKKYAEGKSVRITKAALGARTEVSWPGNVRQLENEVRRALVLGGDRIDVAELSFAGRKSGAAPAQERFDLRGRVDALERTLLTEALAETRGNQTRAAELLGLSRFGLTKMLKRLGVAVP